MLQYSAKEKYITKIKLDKDEATRLFREDHDSFEVVEEGEWVQDHKYQSCDTVYKHLPSGNFFLASYGRSGSYHTDWYYDHEDYGLELLQVEKHTKMVEVTEWKAV